MERHLYSSTSATADSHESPENSVRLYERSWFDRLCLTIFTCGGRRGIRSSTNSTLTRPPNLIDSVRMPLGLSDATLQDVTSISRDTSSVPKHVKSKRLFVFSDSLLQQSDQVAGHSLPPQDEQWMDRPRSYPLPSNVVDKLKLLHASSEDSGTDSTIPNTGSMESSEITTFQNVRRVVVDWWNRARHVRLRRSSNVNLQLIPAKESISSSTPVKAPSDTTTESVIPTIDISGPSHTVFKKYETTPDETGQPLLGKEGSGNQTPETPMSTLVKSFASMSMLDVPSKSRDSLSTTQDSEKAADPSIYKPLLGGSTDPLLSETCKSTPTKSLSSEDELYVSSRTAESLLPTHRSSFAQTTAGYLPLADESAQRIIPEICVTTPNESCLIIEDFDIMTKSTESSSAIQSVSEERPVDSGDLPLSAESTGTQELQMSISGDGDSISRSTESTSISQQVSGAETVAGIRHLLLAESTGAQSSEIELDSVSRSTELTSISQQVSGAETEAGIRHLLLAESTGAQSSEIELDSTSKLTDSVSTSQLSGAEEASGHLLLAENTDTPSGSSGVELDLITKSTESLNNQQSITESTSLPVSKMSTSEQVPEICTESVLSDDELEFSTASTELSSTTEQSTSDKKVEVAADENSEQTEPSSEAAKSSELEEDETSSEKSPEDEGGK